MVKVSVIIPVYNVEKYLRQCVESARNQSMQEIEILCINDGSTDGSGEILRQMAEEDSRIRVVDKANTGYGHTMNTGIDMAAGRYLVFLESDDFILPQMCQVFYELCEKHNLDMVKADFFEFKTKGEQICSRYRRVSNYKNYHEVITPGEHTEIFYASMYTWTCMYRREFINKYGIRHHETPGASYQDNGFWFQTFIYGKRGMIVDRPYYRNRRDNPDSSVKSKEKVYCINAEYDYIRGILLKDPALWERFRHMYWFKKYHNYMGTLWGIDEKYREEYLMRFSEELKRGIALGDLVREPFSCNAWNNIRSITEDPKKYYLTRVYPAGMNQKVFEQMQALETENRKLKEEIASIRRSKTFRLGKILLFLPGRLKRMLRRRKR